MAWNLTVPNSLDIYSRTLNVQNFDSDASTIDTLTSITGNITTLNATTGNITNVVSDNLKTTTGSNYLGQYSGTKTYQIGDIVLYQNLLYRALQVTSVQPNPADPAQTEWISLTSNNAVKNDPSYLQVSVTYGDDAKALLGPVPFKTIQAAIDYGSSNSIIVLIDQGSVYDCNGLVLSGVSNLVIDGQNKATYVNSGNVINLTATGQIGLNNVVWKNVIIRTDPSIASTTVLFGNNSKNITFDNVVFDSTLNNTAREVWLNNSSPLIEPSDIVFYNCRAMTSDPTQFITVHVGNTNGVINTALTRVFCYNVIGPLCPSSNISDVANQELYEYYVSGCKNIIGNGGLGATLHSGGLCVISDSVITTVLNSTATNVATKNKLVVSNCTLLNPLTGTYSRLNKTGNCPYAFQNFDFDKNISPANVITGTGVDYTMGPARYFNQVASFGTVVGTTALTTGTITQLPFGAVTSDVYDIVSIVNPNELTINGAGTFSVLLNLESSTGLATVVCSVSIWIGPVGSTEGTSTYASSYISPSVSSTATFPTMRFTSVLTGINQAANTVYAIYLRNTSATTFNVRMIGMYVTQSR